MKITRRELVAATGALAATGMLGARGFAETLSSAPMARMPLGEFVQRPELMAALRTGVLAMKARPPSDPLSWFYQAAIHGVTKEKIEEATKIDPNVSNVDVAKYWNQCPHFGQSSANFLPWHRGYTYYFERILRKHSGRPDFSLPYWNYNEQPLNERKFPRDFGIQYLDGDMNNEDPANINPLWEPERDFYFTSYQHPLTTNIPLLGLTDEAVDISLPMASPVFFGETEQLGLGGGDYDQDTRTRGLLESYPHDQIHRAVGGVIGTHAGAMATPPTAGFDPIFCIHHTNIDWLWARWSCMSGKSWGRLPGEAWFAERPWFFFDEVGNEVNEPRRHFFDHRRLGVRFKYEDMSCSPLQLPSPGEAKHTAAAVTSTAPQRIATTPTRVVANPRTPTVFPIDGATASLLRSPVATFAAEPDRPSARRLHLRLNDIELQTLPTVGFDVHLTTNPAARLSRANSSFVGSVHLFNHRHEGMAVSQDFDVTRAAATARGDVTALKVVFVPYPLLRALDNGAGYHRSQPLTVRGIEFRLIG